MKKQLGCFLYRSEISGNQDASCVAGISKFSRRFNEDHGITGVLIFDGHRFVQYLEGPQHLLEQLIQKISIDPRHTNFTAQHQVRGMRHRLFKTWAVAYVSVDDADPLAQMWTLSGDAAMHYLEQLLPLLDAA